MKNVCTSFWVLGLLGLAGCADYARMANLTPAGVDERSGAADAVRASAATTYSYPKFKALPPKPADVRPLAAFGAEAKTLEGKRDALTQWAATHPAEVTDSEGYAGVARKQVLDPARAAPPEDQAARSEAWAERLRKAAKPPPAPSS